MSQSWRTGLFIPLIWRLTLLFAICIIAVTKPVQAVVPNQPLVVGPLQVLEDPSTTATLDQILARQAQFTVLSSTSPNFGFTLSAYWLRIPVQNPTSEAKVFYLDIKNLVLEYATLYVVHQGALQETIESGDHLPPAQRPYAATTLVLPFHLAAGASADLYIRVKSDAEPLFVPFELLDEKAIQAAVNWGWVLNSLLLGICGALFIYNCFVFFLLRSRLHLYYIIFLPVSYLAAAEGNGFGPTFLYPGIAGMTSSGMMIFGGISSVLNILILRELLQSKSSRWVERWLKLFIFIAAIQAISPFLWSKPVVYELIISSLFIYPIFCTIISITVWWYGQTEIRFYLLGQLCIGSTIILTGLFAIGVLPYHLLIYQSTIIGLAAEAFFLSFALADHIRLLQQARLQAEAQARQNLEIRGEELERLVAERTAEIKSLQGTLPICANCKKIRNEQGAWEALESYISQHTDAEFSHGICADCVQILYGEVYRKRQQNASFDANI